MKFSYDWLKELSGTKIKSDKLAELLTLHSFEVKNIEKKMGDWILDIDVLPNRAHDCFSHMGVAREIAILSNSKLQIPNHRQITNPKLQTSDFVNVDVRNKNLCSRYTARAVTNIKVGPSPRWLRERLKVLGLKSINNVVDITNYVMLELGQPLHAFDFDKISSIQNKKLNIYHSPSQPPCQGNEFHCKNKKDIAKIKNIIVRRAKKGEKITTLDGGNYNLDESVLVIADEKEPLAIAGIKGGKKAEIDKKTKTIILESANFNSLAIRRTSRKLNLLTDSSKRFEVGLDPNLAEIAINRVSYLIQEIAKGRLGGDIIDIYFKKVKPREINLTMSKIRSLLGQDLAVKEVKSILKKLNFQFSIFNFQFRITVPTRRLDIEIEEDLIEEIARIVGYNKIPSVLPVAPIVFSSRNDDIFWSNMIRDSLVGMGFSEIHSYSFVSEDDLKNFFLRSGVLELENPISREVKYLAPSLIPNMAKVVKDNMKRFDEVKVFEIGNIFTHIKNQKFGLLENNNLAGIIVYKDSRKASKGFYEIKGVVDFLLNRIGISDVNFHPPKNFSNMWQKDSVLNIEIGNNAIGFVGEINKPILDKLYIKERIFVFDIDLEKLTKEAVEEHMYIPISKYPELVRDIAILVPLGILVDEVSRVIERTGGLLVRDVDLFDMYEGERIPDGLKNLAFHVIYQADDRTLTDKEVDKIHKKIDRAIEEMGWEVRK